MTNILTSSWAKIISVVSGKIKTRFSATLFHMVNASKKLSVTINPWNPSPKKTLKKQNRSNSVLSTKPKKNNKEKNKNGQIHLLGFPTWCIPPAANATLGPRGPPVGGGWLRSDPEGASGSAAAAFFVDPRWVVFFRFRSNKPSRGLEKWQHDLSGDGMEKLPDS